MSRDLGVPPIGCASHRFNLEVKNKIVSAEPILKKVDEIFTLLRTSKRALFLSTLTDVRPQKRNTTRWWSTQKFLGTYFKIQPFITNFDREVLLNMLDDEEDTILRNLYENFEFFEVTSKSLQENNISILGANDRFTVLHEQFPDMKNYTTYPVQGGTVESSKFETAVLKVQSGRIEELTDEEYDFVSRWKKNDSTSENVAVLQAGKKRLFSNRVAEIERQRIDNKEKYQSLDWIPATSNQAERLFSIAKILLGSNRHSLSKKHLNMELMLRLNHHLWDEGTVKTIERSGTIEIEIDDSDEELSE
ncbi:hypothetical protein RCL1_007539 [Eukaryota sp. TZLM3-RCL]